MSNNFIIKCGPKQMKLIEDHCFSETEVEVGGFLVGLIGDKETLVSNVFPAKHTVGASTQLTFTHESWNALYEQLKAEPEGTTLVGWYHSHPNFGIFLSEHDKFIQSNFFKQDGNVTIVVDPIRGRKGWFYSQNGKIEKYKQEMNTDRPRLGESATDAAANIGPKSADGVSLKNVIVISATMSLLSFVLGWTATSLTSGGGNASQESVSSLTKRVALIETYLRQHPIAVAQVPVKPKPENSPRATSTPTVKASSKTTSSATKVVSPPASAQPVVALNKPCSTVGAIDVPKNLKCTEVKQKNKKVKVWKAQPQQISGGTVSSPIPTTSGSGTSGSGTSGSGTSGSGTSGSGPATPTPSPTK